jgi:hypothetical protein
MSQLIEDYALMETLTRPRLLGATGRSTGGSTGSAGAGSRSMGAAGDGGAGWRGGFGGVGTPYPTPGIQTRSAALTAGDAFTCSWQVNRTRL